MTSIFLIPGNQESPDQEKWIRLSLSTRELGLNTVGVPIKWKYRTMDSYVEQFLQFYEQQKTEQNIVLGFSFGAMVAFLSAAQTSPIHLVLCSLSPFFKEDLKYEKVREKGKRLGKRRLDSFLRLEFNQLAQGVKAPTTLLLGEEEIESVQVSVKRASRKIPNNRLVVVPGVGHDIGNQEYQDAVIKELKKLKF